MAKIELNSYDFQIKEYQGDEVIQLKPSLAFDSAFIEEMKAKGVGYAKKRDEDEQ